MHQYWYWLRIYYNNNVVKCYTAFTLVWQSFQTVLPCKGNISLQKIHTLSTTLLGRCVRAELVITSFYDSTWRQRWLQWTDEVEAGSCGAMLVWLTFSCTVRLSITPLLLWLTQCTDSTLWFYGERMWAHCGSFSPVRFSVDRLCRSMILLVALYCVWIWHFK